MIPIIIGTVLAATGIVTLIIGSKKIKINKQTKELNEQLQRETIALEKEREKEFYKLKEVKSELDILNQQLENNKEQSQKSFESYIDILDLTYQAKENEFDLKIKTAEQEAIKWLEENKQETWEAFDYYVNELDKYYIKVETDFDVALSKIKISLKENEEELEKIKNTYAAAREAQIREEEIAQQEDFYSLHLNENEKATIYLIEELKPRLPDPRVLCMLIWTTFFQKQTTALCNNVLGVNTVCGIYKITNKNNGLCYIGQSTDCAKRWKEHIKHGLGIDTPVQNKLYKAMLKDGVTNFTFELLEQCDRQLLNEKEKFYINLYQAYDYGYNSTIGNK